MRNKRNIIIILVVLCTALSTIYLWSGVIGPEIHKLKEHRGEDEVWNILGTVIRNVSGILTFVTAVFTACVLIYTNNTRAREAVNSEYRDQMQWACEKIEDKKENTYEQLFALELIGRYGECPPRKLSRLDIEINYRIQEAVLSFEAYNGSNITLNNAIANAISKIESQVSSRRRIEGGNTPKEFMKNVLRKIFVEFPKCILNMLQVNKE